MLNSILLGMALAAVTIVVHATGTSLWIKHLRWRSHKSVPVLQTTSGLGVLCATAIALLSIHIVEVVIWSFAYLLIVGGKTFATVEEAVYFSTVTFASLGYGDVVIDGPWRLLSAIQSMIGLLVFGWSSALLFAVVQRILEGGGNLVGTVANKSNAREHTPSTESSDRAMRKPQGDQPV